MVEGRETEPMDYSGHRNRPGFAVPPMSEPFPTATETYQVEVPPVSEVWAQNDHYRWSPEAREETRQDLTVPERYGVEEMVSDPDAFPNSVSGNMGMGPDPKWTPPDVQPVSTPSQWRFFRPFGHDVEWRFNGDRFSMADQTREYPIYGMQPWDDHRNTYRTEPPPRDVTIQDMPPETEGNETPNAQFVTPTPDFRMFGPSQPWRL